MPVTGPWRRLDETDDWHFCTNCHFYPDRTGVETTHTRPTSGTVCVWCRRLVADNGCS
jgi:hypothetical protein